MLTIKPGLKLLTMKTPLRIVRGQYVAREKLARAKQLRQEMTPHEAQLWDKVRKNGLNGLHFRRQQVVDGFILDFYCHQAALVVEIDGPIHEHQAAYDAERSHWLQAQNLRVLRITNAEIDADIETALTRNTVACCEQLADVE